MKGGFNKILRNIVAGSSDTEFEKVRKRKLMDLTLLFELLETHEGHIPPGFQGAKGEACDL